MFVSLKLTACVGTCIQHACRFPQLTGLIHHLEKEHALLVTISHHTFSSHTKFQSWKSAEEECSQAHHVQTTSTKSIGEFTHTYFYCNRSGVGVEHCETHHNHDIQLSHLRVPDSVSICGRQTCCTCSHYESSQ